MHIKYPSNVGRFRWDELSCLCKALGFPGDFFTKNLPAEWTLNKCDISIEDLQRLLGDLKSFKDATNETINFHSSQWNLASIRMCLRVLNDRLLSFSDLETIRLSYTFNESADTRGMPSDIPTVLRALKLCNLTISPRKLRKMLALLLVDKDNSDRLQLDHFINITQWCHKLDTVSITDPTTSPPHKKNHRSLYLVDDFADILVPKHERTTRYLDSQYSTEQEIASNVNIEWTSVPFKTDDKLVLDGAQYRPAEKSCHFSELSALLKKSKQRVASAKAGVVRSRPVSAPDLTRYSSQGSCISTLITAKQDTLKSSPSADLSFTSGDADNMLSRLSFYQRPKTAILVQSNDVDLTSQKTTNLEFEQMALDFRYKQQLYEDLEFTMPGYHRRLAARPKVVSAPRRSVKHHRKQIPSAETLERLSSACRGGSSPTHDRVCDARIRGWSQNPNQTVAVLDSSSYEKSMNGQLFARMDSRLKRESKRRQCFVIRPKTAVV